MLSPNKDQNDKSDEIVKLLTFSPNEVIYHFYQLIGNFSC